MSLFSLLGAVEIGLIFSLVALGVYISFRLLRFPDLTVDGSFPLGGAVCAILISTGTNPWLATLAATAAGYATCPLSQALELASTRTRVRYTAGAIGYPQLLIRIGRPAENCGPGPSTRVDIPSVGVPRLRARRLRQSSDDRSGTLNSVRFKYVLPRAVRGCVAVRPSRRVG